MLGFTFCRAARFFLDLVPFSTLGLGSNPGIISGTGLKSWLVTPLKWYGKASEWTLNPRLAWLWKEPLWNPLLRLIWCFIHILRQWIYLSYEIPNVEKLYFLYWIIQGFRWPGPSCPVDVIHLSTAGTVSISLCLLMPPTGSVPHILTVVSDPVGILVLMRRVILRLLNYLDHLHHLLSKSIYIIFNIWNTGIPSD